MYNIIVDKLFREKISFKILKNKYQHKNKKNTCFSSWYFLKLKIFLKNFSLILLTKSLNI
ncbi:hypothetical protein HMPREF1871_00022 [Gemelliphila asaccharolytica]|uniref:Uncharacterized protein n=1 Tax=Gemelliphila asaccharolytica TaxID=502393 RepID=A0ABR5TNI1_9BACL|nr:hypothetical protein HMPREF1871_00022 [Gemella asaccharolytica]